MKRNFVLSFIYFFLVVFYGFGKSNTNNKDREKLIIEYASKLDSLIDRNYELLQEGKVSDVTYFLDLRDQVIRNASPIPADYKTTINGSLNAFNGSSRSDQQTSFYVLLTSIVGDEQDNTLTKILDDLNKQGKLKDLSIDNIKELNRLYAGTKDPGSLKENLSREENFTQEIIERSKLGDDKHLGVLLHYHHHITNALKYYKSSIAFDKRISEVTKGTVLNEIVDPLRKTLSVDDKGTVSTSSLLTIIAKEVDNAIKILGRDFKSDYDLLIREAVDALDLAITKNGAPSKTKFSYSGKNYILRTNEKVIGLIKEEDKLNKTLCWYEFKTGKPFYVVMVDAIAEDFEKRNFIADVIGKSKKFNSKTGTLLTVQCNPTIINATSKSIPTTVANIYGSDTKDFTSEITEKLNKVNIADEAYDKFILEMYRQLPKPYTSFTYFFRIDGKVLFVKHTYKSVSGYSDIARLNFYYDKENVEAYRVKIIELKYSNGDYRIKFLKDKVYDNAIKNPKIDAIPHDLKEEFIEEYHESWIYHHLYDNCQSYFAIDYPKLKSIPDYATTTEIDQIKNLFDISSVLLSPYGLDVVPDVLGGIYCLMKGDDEEAMYNLASVPLIMIPSGVSKKFIHGAEFVYENGILVLKGKTIRDRLKEILFVSDEVLDELISVKGIEILIFEEDLVKKINTLSSDYKNEILNQIIKSEDFYKLLIIDNKNVDAWAILNGLDEKVLAIDPLWLKRVNNWNGKGLHLLKNGGSLKLTDATGNILGEFNNGNLLPEEYSNMGVPIGELLNGYQLLENNGIFGFKRIPDISAYSASELTELTQHPIAHVLERHGHDVTDDALLKRANRGLAPDGSFFGNSSNPTKPPYSSKFESPDKLKLALSSTRPGSVAFANKVPNQYPNGYNVTFELTDGTFFGRGVPKNGNYFEDMNKVLASYEETSPGHFKLVTMYPTK